ncbi:glycosyltransferase family 39 protein [Micromonospora sp. NPDC050397]|uniref:glycosyltransferase family 39 protein n=1 Tax=Micromonospora sp. NPDC050397 TaxID=3364279 RepID=UPI00384D43C3
MTDAETMVMPRVGASAAPPEDPWGEDRVGADGGGEQPDRVTRRRDSFPVRTAAWMVPGMLMGTLGLMGSAAPGLWTDELTTWDHATSSWRANLVPAYWADASDVPYHLLMRAWVELLGSSDLALRLPSILAMTLAAMLVAMLATRLYGARVGLFAGVIFALLPTSTRYAQEARPYALTLLVAVLATYFLVLAAHRPRLWRFVGYGLAVVLLGLSHAIALVLLVGHGWVLLAFRRRILTRWVVTASVGAFPAVALLLLGYRTVGPPSWTTDSARELVAATPVELFGVTALGALLLGLALFSLPLRRSTAIYTAWAVVPLLVLPLVARVTPLPLVQCLVFTLPAWATLAAVALGRARAVWGVGVLAAIVVIGLPVQAAQRGSDGHRQATRQLAGIVQYEMRSGDAVVYVAKDPGGGAAGRDALDRYLPTGYGLVDVLGGGAGGGTGGSGAGTGSDETGGEVRDAECLDATGCLGDTRRVWVIRVGERTDPLRDVGGRTEELLRTRYEMAQVWRPTGFTLALLVDGRPQG